MPRVRRAADAGAPDAPAPPAGAARARERLLAAAAALYARVGALGATTRRLAEEAGVNEVTLFRQFGSKQALLAAAAERCLAGLVVALPAAPVDPPGELAAWCAAQTVALRRVRGVLRRASLDADAGAHADLGGDPAFATVLPRAYGAVAVELRAYAHRLRDGGHPGARGDLWTRAALLTAALFTAALWQGGGVGDAAPGSTAESSPDALAAAFLDPSPAPVTGEAPPPPAGDERAAASTALHAVAVRAVALCVVAVCAVARAAGAQPAATADTAPAYREPTGAEYARRLVGPRAVVRVVALSVIDQTIDSPDGWDRDARGYANRLGTRAVGHAITQSMEMGVAVAFHVRRARPSRCGCTGFGPRLTHAVLTPFRAETPGGTRLSPLMPLGDVAGAVLTTPLLPGGYSTGTGLRRGVTAGLLTVAAGTAVEFWPRRWLPRRMQGAR